MLLEFKAKRALRKKIKEGQDLVTQITETESLSISESVEHWLENCKYICRHYLGQEHYLTDRINDIGIPIVFKGDPTPDSEFLAAFEQSINKSLTLLKLVITEIDKNGLVVHSIPQHFHFITWVIAIFAILLGYSLSLLFPPPLGRNSEQTKLGNDSENFFDSLNIAQLEEQNKSKADIMITDLRSWYEENNQKFKKEFEKLANSQSRRGIFESPIAIGEVVEFAKDWRLKRDNKIDSFFVRLQALDVDTDTLRIIKKLPIRLDEDLKGRISRLDLSPIFIRSLRLDTL